MLLTEGQMSDHKGARLILDALLPADTTPIADRGYGSVKRLKPRASRPAFHQPKAVKPRSNATRAFIATVTRSRTGLSNSRTGGVRRKIRSMRNAFFSAICIAAALVLSLHQ